MTDAPEVVDSTILVLQKLNEMSINIQQNQVQTQKDIEQIQKDQQDLSKHLFNEMPHKRRKEIEASVSRSNLSAKQLEFQEKYRTDNFELRLKSSADFGTHHRGNCYRKFKPILLTDYPFLTYDNENGKIECIVCGMGGGGWSSESYFLENRIIDHKYSRKHQDSLANVRRTLHMNETNQIFEFPFREKLSSMARIVQRASVPLEVERVAYIFDVHIKQLIQGTAARGGASECFGTARLKNIKKIG